MHPHAGRALDEIFMLSCQVLAVSSRPLRLSDPPFLISRQHHITH
jgi:hypothetical protein